MKILFVCKHNRFRSRVASSYFNNLNKKSKNKAKSAGIYSDYSALNRDEVGISGKFGIDIRGKPRKVNNKLLKWADLIFIVADDVKISQIKYHKKYKIIQWKIKDVDNAKNVKLAIKQTVKKIIKRVDSLNRD
jgi:protein-tyrosine-phosphatase